ncbi:MAG: phospholipase D-like domain-containing protein [Chloroflexota bacterium]|nr:phospholipase D-like domain-containing protein [Chloroflexota bacterium]
MSDDTIRTVEPIRSPWRDMLLDALAGVERRLLIVCPYIKEAVVTAMTHALLAGGHSGLEIRIITRVNPDDLLSGACDIGALQHLLAWHAELPGSTVKMRAIPNLHAKVWVCDSSLALVGSGNATSSGLDANLEYGLAVSDTQLLERILGDWQGWWDQAERVEVQMLAEIALKLEQVWQSEAMKQSRAQAVMLQRELNAIPRVGKRITPGPAPVPSPVINEQRTPYAAPDTRVSAVEESFTVFAFHLWQALHWTCPDFQHEGAYRQPTAEPQRGTFLKLSWRPQSTERPLLQCIWADGQRLSLATIPGKPAATQQPWTITCNLEHLHRLGDFFVALDHCGLLDERVATLVRLALRGSSPHLHLEYAGGAAEITYAADLSIPCTIASIPARFPILRPPLSQITLEHIPLLAAILSLKREWYTLYPSAQPLSVIEIRLVSPASAPAMTLSTGQIAAPIARTIPGQNSTIAGSETSIRLDFNALHQVISSGGDNVDSWRVIIDGYAEAIQFIPEPNILRDTTLLWSHEVRGLS